MTYVIYVLLVVAVILAIVSLVFGVKALRMPKYSMSELLCGYIRENRGIYGVCNHGISMDDIESIQIVSPKDIGL